MITVPALDIGPGAVVKSATSVPHEVAIPVKDLTHPGAKITKVTIVTNQNKFASLQKALDDMASLESPSLTCSATVCRRVTHRNIAA
jgi:hypothetical protein